MRRALAVWGSLKMAVLILPVLAGVLVWAGSLPHEVALRTVYRTPWFAGLLALLGVNVASAALVRYPWKRHQTGFVVTHLGILVLLAGSLLTQWRGVEGSVLLSEGGRAEEAMTLDERVLWVGERGYPLPLDPRRPTRLPSGSFSGPGGVALTVAEYLPHALKEKRVAWNRAGGRPAVHFRLANDQVSTEEWMVAGVHDMEIVSLGPVTSRILPVGAEDWAAWRRNPEAAAGLGEVEVREDGRLLGRLPVASARRAAQTIPGTAYRVRITRLFRHALVEGGALVEKSPKWVNPAVEAVVEGPLGAERHTAFALFPEFASMHGKSDARLKLTYRPPAGASGPTLLWLAGPEGRFAVACLSPGRPPRVEDVRPGSSLVTPWMNLGLTVVAAGAHADVIEEFRAGVVEEGKTGYPEALRVVVGGQQMWLELEQAALVGNVALAFRRGTRPLGFALRLKEFVVERDPGTSTPAAFSSTVEVEDPRGTRLTTTISMNQPLAYGGYKLFQASYVPVEPGQPEISILQVARDPGIGIKYAGSLLIVGGIITMFVSRAARTPAVPNS